MTKTANLYARIEPELTEEELDAELTKGFDEIEAGRLRDLAEVQKTFAYFTGLKTGKDPFCQL